MKHWHFVLWAPVAAILMGCSTEPYQKSIGDFAKGISSAQSALVALDRRNVEVLRLAQLNSIPSISIAGCEFNRPCLPAGVPESRPIIPVALLAMAKIVTYTNGLIELAAAKDTEAMKAAIGKANNAAGASVKSFEAQVSAGAIAVASGNIIALIADEIIDAQRFSALQDVIKKNRYAIDRTLSLLAGQADDLRKTVFLAERSNVQLIANKANTLQDSAERRGLIEEFNRRAAELDTLSKADAHPAFVKMRSAHRELANAVMNPTVSFEDVAAKILDFVSKSQALEAAVRKG